MEENEYEVTEGDLALYPELSEQGVSVGDKVTCGSLWVSKWATSAMVSKVKEAWPRSLGIKGRGITFKGSDIN